MTILCIGDSNTHGYDPRSYTGARYPHPSSWAEILAGQSSYRIINTAINGQRIPRYMPEIELYRQRIENSKPDFIIIMLGSNDLLEGCSPGDAAKNMGAFISHLAASSDKILLISPPPFILGAWTDELLIEKSKFLSETYYKLSRELGINYIDSRKWQIELAYDGVHFTENGHRQFAEKLISYMEEKI